MQKSKNGKVRVKVPAKNVRKFASAEPEAKPKSKQASKAVADAQNVTPDFSTMTAEQLAAFTPTSESEASAYRAEVNKRSKAFKALEKLASDTQKTLAKQAADTDDKVREVLQAALDDYKAAGAPPHRPVAFDVRDFAITIRKRGTRTGERTEVESLSASELADAGLQSFTTSKGKALTARDGKSVTPNAYLDNVAGDKCYFNRPCPVFAAIVTSDVTPEYEETGDAKYPYKVTSPESLVSHLSKSGKSKIEGGVTAVQYAAMQAGELKHGDSADRDFPRLARNDKTTRVKLSDGRTMSLPEFVEHALAVKAANNASKASADNASE